MLKKSGSAILFCLGIFLLINIIVAFLVIDYVDFLQDPQKFSNNIVILNWIALSWLIASTVILLKAVLTREKFDSRLKWGSALLILVLVITVAMSFS